MKARVQKIENERERTKERGQKRDNENDDKYNSRDFANYNNSLQIK